MRLHTLQPSLVALMFAIVTVFAIPTFGVGAPQAGSYLGELRVVGNGVIATWVTINRAGAPAAIGVTMTEGVLTDLPQDDAEYVLALPSQAAETPFNHFALDWMPHGHAPTEIYGVPHFDFHFYMITQAQRELITAEGEDLARVERTPAPAFVPEGYVPTPGGVPHMGAHWVDPTSPEFHGQPFTETFIYGFYDGRMIFIEPMASREFLLSQPNVRRAVRLPAAYPTHGFYPTSYAIIYDPARHEYTIALEGLTYRE